MFKVNDYVVYGLTGVCLIEDIRPGEYADNCDAEYYVLQPVYSENMTIKVPVDSTNIMMRAICSKDDVLSLISMMPAMEAVWIDNDKQRVVDYKAALRTGKTEEWARIIKALYLEKETRSIEGRKLRKADEDILNTAERYLNEEFAIALNIAPEDVVDYIAEHIPN